MQTKEIKANVEGKEKKDFPIGFFDPDLAALLSHLEPTKKVAVHCALYIQALDRVSPRNTAGERAISVPEIREKYLPFLTHKNIRRAKERLAQIGVLKKRVNYREAPCCIQRISIHRILELALALKRKAESKEKGE